MCYHSNGPWPTVEKEEIEKRGNAEDRGQVLTVSMLNPSSEVGISTFITELQLCATSSAQITSALRY